MLVLSVFGALLNIAINRFALYSGIPLYMDTILTISITLAFGLVWGAFCGTLTNVISHTIWGWSWGGYLYALCNIATAFITWIFCRYFQRELLEKTPDVLIQPAQKSSKLSKIMDKVIILLLLSFSLCLAMSILGGLITAFILRFNPSNSEEVIISALLSATMFDQNAPTIIKEIISRIPVNIIDRSISAFAGYGISLLIYRFFKTSVFEKSTLEKKK